MDTEGLFGEEANDYSRAEAERSVCSTSLPPSYPSMRDWLNFKLVTVLIFHSSWFLRKQFTLKHLSITLHALLAKLLQTACRPG